MIELLNVFCNNEIALLNVVDLILLIRSNFSVLSESKKKLILYENGSVLFLLNFSFN